MLGRAIVLVGVSSVGKTSLSEELQERLAEPFLHVGLDHFFSMFPYQWRGHPRGPGPGFWVDVLTDEAGAPHAHIHYGEAGERMLVGMRAAVNALLATGNNVILDEMPIDSSIVPAWRRDLRAASALWVHLTAPLAVLEERERGRKRGRVLGNARGHLDIDHGHQWDLAIATEGLTTSDIADQVLAAFEPPS